MLWWLREAALLPMLHYLPNSKARDRERGLSKQVFSVKDLQNYRGQCEARIFQRYMVHQASHSGS